ncbi:MAG TPA: trypsin-like peptidase domain-containing protein [Gaiellaceae bacterium]|nr:trypsin-like peptidase domain-containing protein [Gaiellaceae bacterium]
MHRPSRTTIASLAAAAAVGAGGATGGLALVGDLGSSPPAVQTAAVAAPVQPAAATSGTLSVHQIYAQDGPGVVDITATSSGGGTNASPFPFGQGGGSSSAEGSGFVYDTSGHVITNEHVVDGASSIKIQLASGKTYTATVVGSDPSTDIAVLKVDAPDSALKPLPLGDSSAVEVGDGVVAIGSPFGLEQSVTAGIVSALHRQIQAPNKYTIGNAIQTDAAINHGNSGGPLIDLHGNVIGVNAQIQSDSGDNAGVGFAIPSNTVAKVAAQLISGGQVQHAYLGVSIGDAPGGGVRVGAVKPDSPAAKAGLQVGDVITALDGHSVADSAALGLAVDGHEPGDKVTLTYTRGGSSQTVTLTLGTRPETS